MHRPSFVKRKLLNWLQTLLLVAGMGLLLLLSARLLFGDRSFAWVLTGAILMLGFTPQLSPYMVLRWYRARALNFHEAPNLYRVLSMLAAGAGLARLPALYYVPSRVLNAFTVGHRNNAAIAVTDGLLRRMSLRELCGVLAHEISHVRNDDMRVMGLADMVTRITALLSWTGQFLVVLNLPLILLAEVSISWTAILILVFAPTLAAVLQLALSRIREFDADLDAVRLTGDPSGLAAALDKLESYQGGFLERLFLPRRRNPAPSLLRTHPQTKKRIERLLSLMEKPHENGRLVLPSQGDDDLLVGYYPRITRRPGRHSSGLWF